jgi:hypothetical protein
MIRARPFASARTTAQLRAIDVTQAEPARGRVGDGRVAGVFVATLRGVDAAAFEVPRVVATRDGARFGVDLATFFFELFAVARGDAARGGAGSGVTTWGVAAATRVGLVAVDVSGGGAARAGVSAVGEVVGGGTRRMTDGGGSHGSRRRALSMTTRAESTTAFTESPAFGTFSSTTVDSRPDVVASLAGAASLVAVSMATTPVETS